MKEQIPLSRPDIDAADIEAVAGILKSHHLSLGPKGPEFEQAIADYVGCRHAVAVNSGTSGLHLAVLALDLRPGDEVITTPFSFVASTNCLLFEKVRPVFADIHPETWDLDPEMVEKAISERTRALLPVHVFGRVLPVKEMLELAQAHDLKVIEDSCESLGSSMDGRMTGTFGDIGVFAFYPNKQMTTGEGGVVVTDDEEMAGLCRSLRNQGRGPESPGWDHPRMGYNYRLSDVASALGLSQLSRLETFIAKRQGVFDLYGQSLSGLPGVRLPAPPRPGTRTSWFVYVIRLDDDFTRAHRDRVLEGLRRRGIGCRDYFQPIHLQPYMRQRFGYQEGDFPVTEGIAARSLALPFHNNLTAGEVSRVAAALGEAIRECR